MNIRLACLLTALGGILTTHADSGLLKNGNLDGDPAPFDWEVNSQGGLAGDVLQDQDAGQEGTAALKVEHTEGGRHTQIRQYVDLPDSSATYVLRGRAKTLGILPKSAESAPAVIGVYTVEGNAVASQILQPNSEWQEFELPFSRPELGRVLVMIYFDAEQGALWVEKLSLLKEPSGSP